MSRWLVRWIFVCGGLGVLSGAFRDRWIAFLQLRIPDRSFSLRGWLSVVLGLRCRRVAWCGLELLGLRGGILDVRIL